MNKTNVRIYAEDVPYFQTGSSSADTWIDRAKREILGIGGKIAAEAFGADDSGYSAFMLSFAIGTESFKVVWPVLPSRSGKEKAAKIQSATALYHDVKARVVSAKFTGVRSAFFSYLVLPNGQVVTTVSTADVLLPGSQFSLPAGNK